jgi:hypothetical protein
MGLAFTLAAVAAGLAFGGLVGFKIGEAVRGSRWTYWALNISVVLGCAVLDFAGLVAGRYWLAYSAIGLMAGLITGMKYGYVDSMRVWRGAGPDDPLAGAPDEAQSSEGVTTAAETPAEVPPESAEESAPPTH